MNGHITEESSAVSKVRVTLQNSIKHSGERVKSKKGAFD